MKIGIRTTAIPETWPQNCDRTFMLGPWVSPGEFVAGMAQEKSEFIHCPWQKELSERATYQLEQDTYVELMERLTAWLNETHGLEYPQRYWELLVGYWLWCLVQIVHERLASLLYVSGQYPESVIPVQTESFFRPPPSTSSFFHGTYSDSMNYEVYSYIAKFLKLNTQNRPLSWQWGDSPLGKDNGSGIALRLLKGNVQGVLRYQGLRAASLFGKSCLVGNNRVMLLANPSRFGLFVPQKYELSSQNTLVDFSARGTLKSLVSESDSLLARCIGSLWGTCCQRSTWKALKGLMS